jgi:hypothetical protein
VKFGGRTEHSLDEQGPSYGALGAGQSRQRRAVRHADSRLRQQHREYAAAVARRGAGGLRRLTFNRGDYYGAVQQKITSENLTKILYPNDEQLQGKEHAAEQQYFFVACSLQGHAAHPQGAEDSARELSSQVSPLSSTTRIRRSRSPS